MELLEKYAINKKSTILVWSLLNLVKMTIPWVCMIGKISAWYVENCVFFINDMF